MVKIDAKGVHYRKLNEQIREYIKKGEKEIVLDNINGQRYIGCNLDDDVKIKINGVPGNDLAFTMNGPSIEIFANGQDGTANTMSSGKIVIHGNAGDITGYAMRGGKLFIEGDVGYRAGIHMKEYKDVYPIIVIGGKTGDFLGEYMAGGLLVVLGLDTEKGKSPVGYLCGTGMHGGRMFIRGHLEEWELGAEVKIKDLSDEEKTQLKALIDEYAKDMGKDLSHINVDEFKKLYPGSSRPYGKLYAY